MAKGKETAGRPKTVFYLLSEIWFMVEAELGKQRCEGKKENKTEAFDAVSKDTRITLMIDGEVEYRIPANCPSRIKDLYYEAERLRKTDDPLSHFMQRIGSPARVSYAIRAHMRQK